MKAIHKRLSIRSSPIKLAGCQLYHRLLVLLGTGGLIGLLLACRPAEPVLPPLPVTPPSVTAVTGTPVESSTVLAGRLRQTVETTGAVSTTTLYSYQQAAGPDQGLLSSYTLLSGSPGSQTMTQTQLERTDGAVASLALVQTTAGRSLSFTQTLSYVAGSSPQRLARLTGQDALGEFVETYRYDAQGRLIGWQRERTSGGQRRVELAVDLSWNNGTISLVRESRPGGDVEEISYGWDNQPNPRRRFWLEHGLPPGYSALNWGPTNPIRAEAFFSGTQWRYEHTYQSNGQLKQVVVSEQVNNTPIVRSTTIYTYF